MPAEVAELRPTIDRSWLASAARREPLVHAYALWDLERAPAQVRFASIVAEGTTVGYLLLWLGHAERPVVHWYGPWETCERLRRALPPPPYVLIAPSDVTEPLGRQLRPHRAEPLVLLRRDPGALPEPPGGARRLDRADLDALAGLVGRTQDPEVAGYREVDPGAEAVWGGFAGRTLVGVARAAVRLPGIWVLSGVYVDPAYRGRGVGAALVAGVANEAGRHGAPLGLYARDDGGPAVRLYRRLGFVPSARRHWLEIGPPGVA